MPKDRKQDPRYKPFRQEYERNRKTILATQEICAICGKPVDKTLKPPDPMSATVDHIIPIAKGGHPSDLSNLQLAHRCCNIRKSDRLESADSPKAEAEVDQRSLPWSCDWLSYKTRNNPNRIT